MGVKGLWSILEPAGRPVKSPECLRNEKVAIDASIWLYQFMRVVPPGSPNSIILSGLFKRICKLIYFDIKPILVFDGTAPILKKKTTMMRSVRRGMAEERFRRIARRLLVKQMQLTQLSKKDTHPKEKEKEETSFNGFEISKDDKINETFFVESEEEEFFELDEETLDVEINKPDFHTLPADLKQYLLMAKKDRMLQQTLNITKEEGSKMPAIDFSHLQVNALVKRRKIAEELEKVKTGSFFDFESEYLGGGKGGRKGRISGKRIASESNRHYVLVKNTKEEGGWSFCTNDQVSVNDSTVSSETAGNKDSCSEDDEFENLFGVADDLSVKEDNAKIGLKLHINDTEKATNVFPDTTEHVEKEHGVVNLPEKEETNRNTYTPIQIVDIPSESSSEEIDSFIENINAEEVAFPSSTTTFSIDNYKESTNQLHSKDVSEEEVDEDEKEEEDQEEQYIMQEALNEVAVGSRLSEQDRTLLIEKLQNEVSNLRAESKAVGSLSTSIDNELLEEFKNMLTIMGIPWMVAPGEAEAQCAWLQSNGHVSTVITDDNDAFLFGATSVHRHFFNQAKEISHYVGRDISRELRLDRTKLIVMSLLLGSDYSVGVRGIGPVMAKRLFQILDAHCQTPEEWMSTISKGLSQCIWPDNISPSDSQFLVRLYEKCSVDESFMLDEAVYRAFMSPSVDDRNVSFTWNMFNDINAIRKYLMRHLRWSEEECKRSLDSLILR